LAVRHRLQRRPQALRHFTPRLRLQAGKTLQHYRTIQALPLILGPRRKADADYLDACRGKRNVLEYDRAGGATAEDARELIEFTRGLREAVIAWLEKEHIELLLPPDKST
jgi:hypothetical protein